MKHIARAMKSSTSYSELLRDPRWQKIRLKKLEAANWCCELCYDDETMLSVHHKRYVKGRMPWEYPEHELSVLCQPCHEAEHQEKEMRADLMAALHVDGPASATDAFAIMAGYVSEQTNDTVMHAIAKQFRDESPYQFESGRFLASVGFSLVSATGFMEMADQLTSGVDTEFVADFRALLEKHGMLRGSPFR
ncbi:hypothetical protein [Stenotrophomonas maltophilia]|uniref:hypothetical protein n=1 Tax=Stenotrophomonas maltophilia TaxID=40324 RepID=UPI0007F8FFD5|nr:hypothetical protein [Stenotrophomonas maltophilia]OBU59206.1 hypothetical protein A9K70_01400 [Stenotrophomonas maltophilia]